MNNNKRSFTLVELLVVMGIIGLLVALLFPAIGAARQAANRGKAEAEVKAIEVAIVSYLRDYGKFPSQTDAKDIDYTGTNYAKLIDILRAVDTTNNPRREVYLEVSTASLVSNEFKDPWDTNYYVKVDGDFDNKITIPSPLSTTLVGRSVAVWSYGPDGTNKNYFITSWGK